MIECISEPEWSLSELCQIVSADPAISISLMKAARAAANRRSRLCETIPEAVLLLGKDVVAGLCLRSAMTMDSRMVSSACNDAYTHYWKQSVIQAITAESLGSISNEKSGLYFLAGLMADIGILGMLVADEERYSALMRRATTSVERRTVMERDTYGFDHVEVSCRLAAAWGIPDQIVQAIQWQHVVVSQLLHSEQGDCTKLAAACFLGSQAAELYLRYHSANAGLLIESVAARHFATSFHQLLTDTSLRLEQLGPILDVDPAELPTVDAILESAESLLSQLLAGQCYSVV